MYGNVDLAIRARLASNLCCIWHISIQPEHAFSCTALKEEKEALASVIFHSILMDDSRELHVCVAQENS